MKIIRQIGSLAFVFGLFTAIFVGIPWYVVVSDDPVYLNNIFALPKSKFLITKSQIQAF